MPHASFNALVQKRLAFRITLCAALLTAASTAQAVNFDQVNLVTDDQAFLLSQGYTAAASVDPHLINPWGMSHSATSPFWVSNQGDNTATLYNGAGAVVPLVVSVPHEPSGPIGPTGQVFNGTSSFALPGSTAGRFFFANLDGSISGWNSGTSAVQVANTPGAVYTGLAIGNAGGNDYLYAANNRAGTIDVFDSSFGLVTRAGAFQDPGANPLGLHPFNVTNLGGHIFVSYATPGPDADEAALGTGFVSEFDTDGSFIRRIADGDILISPWGMEIAPSSFGEFAGALLVGNFAEDNGFISAYRLSDGEFLGAMADADGHAIEIPYLWSLLAGNGGNGGDFNSIYLTAGIGDEDHGLLAKLTAVPEPASWSMMLSGFGVLGAALRSRRRQISAV